SARHWSGSLTDLHLTRWRVWTDWLAAGARSGTEPDPEPLRAEIRRVEEDWRGSTAPYPTEPRGDLAAAITGLLDLAEHELPRLSPGSAGREATGPPSVECKHGHPPPQRPADPGRRPRRPRDLPGRPDRRQRPAHRRDRGARPPGRRVLLHE